MNVGSSDHFGDVRGATTRLGAFVQTLEGTTSLVLLQQIDGTCRAPIVVATCHHAPIKSCSGEKGGSCAGCCAAAPRRAR